MKSIIVTFVIAFSVLNLFCSAEQAEPISEEVVRDGVFIHITHSTDDVHKVLMALQMATIMSESRDVLVYFDIKGIEVVLKDAEDLEYSHFPSSLTQLETLLFNKVTIMACPGCLKAAGKSAEDLRSGVQVANKDTFFNFTKGRILTLDY